MIIEYFLFSQLCQVFAVFLGFYLLKSKLNYDLFSLFSSFRFSKQMFDKTKKLAFTSIFLTFCWILYYELDSFAIAKIYGIKSLSFYAIGFTIITYFRSFFGILFTPFIAKFNYFVGSYDQSGLKLFFKKVLIIFLPLTLFPVVIIYLTIDNFILSWVGYNYIKSIPTASILVLSYIFSFISYPTNILIMANERVKLLYFTSALQPIIFWIGIFTTKDLLGLESFAYFKLVAFIFGNIVNFLIIYNYLEESLVKIYHDIVKPVLLPLCFVVFCVLLFKDFFPKNHGKLELSLYISYFIMINLFGFILYYFTSKEFQVNVNKLFFQIKKAYSIY